ncbi:pirin family protein [Vulgatibacter incomptus]|uniref:Pirin n=1 Tax=Vulgatibacter incomptus TaxID=1391653 RepID=A0A0K1PI59_9BACT|nr:pirin family protein [Vulgatibacter incomptus]AKU93218.1 Pirin [Vulgatibacter incomptus]
MDDTIRRTFPLGFLWETKDPFLFCAHHDDSYPRGNEAQGPEASLEERNLGSDFEPRDGWRMYHGREVPGFPSHPHRGFETVTIVRRGLIDHSDSLGAAARFGRGDVQWLTAGRGIQHAEMFPLVHPDRPNPLELFQIWLNLPRADKRVEPHFTMLWAKDIPTREVVDDAGRRTAVTVVAGTFGDATPPPPPPGSWASRPETDVAIWTLRMEPGAKFTLPAAAAGTGRAFYFFAGSSLRVETQRIGASTGVELRDERSVTLENGPDEAELLLLQGRPIGEPVAAHGPFVMNTMDELRQTFADYQRDRFGGWPWESDAPVHPRESGRFARHADGRIERVEEDLA